MLYRKELLIDELQFRLFEISNYVWLHSIFFVQQENKSDLDMTNLMMNYQLSVSKIFILSGIVWKRLFLFKKNFSETKDFFFI